jgi:hypothetical protein
MLESTNHVLVEIKVWTIWVVSLGGRDMASVLLASLTKYRDTIEHKLMVHLNYLNKSFSKYLIIWFTNRIIKLLEECNLKSYRNNFLR